MKLPNDLEREQAQAYIREHSIWTPFCGCWLWTSGRNSRGYAVSGRRFNGSQRASRITFAAFKGDFNDSLYVLHRCDTKLCVNPDHLFLGTQKDNAQDCSTKHRNTKTKLAAHKRMSGMSFEERSQFAKQRALTLGKERLRKIALKKNATMTPEARSRAASKGWANQTAEQREKRRQNLRNAWIKRR